MCNVWMYVCVICMHFFNKNLTNKTINKIYFYPFNISLFIYLSTYLREGERRRERERVENSRHWLLNQQYEGYHLEQRE